MPATLRAVENPGRSVNTFLVKDRAADEIRSHIQPILDEYAAGRISRETLYLSLYLQGARDNLLYLDSVVGR